MKRLSFVLLAFLAVSFLTFNFNCPKGGKVDISLNPSDSVLDLTPGATYQTQVTLTPDAEQKGVVGKFRVLVDGNAVVDTTYESETAVTYDFSYTVPQDAQVGSSITITFEATDSESGEMNTESVTINVIEYIPEVVEATGKTIDYVSTNANTQMMYIVGDDDVTIGVVDDDNGDFAFFWNDARRHQIYSPDAKAIEDQDAYSTWSYNTSGKKHTKIQKYDGNWEDLTPETIHHLDVQESETYDGSGTGAAHIQEGDIYVFELQDGRKGAFVVKSTTAPYKVEATITVDFKFQKPSAGTAR